MAAQIITKEDLDEFKLELLENIREMLLENTPKHQKKWLKSYEVRKLLGISPGTLQNMRENGSLPFSKIGGLIFYDNDDIQEMLMSSRAN